MFLHSGNYVLTCMLICKYFRSDHFEIEFFFFVIYIHSFVQGVKFHSLQQHFWNEEDDESIFLHRFISECEMVNMHKNRKLPYLCNQLYFMTKMKIHYCGKFEKRMIRKEPKKKNKHLP